MVTREVAIDPTLPVVDSQHHLFVRRGQRRPGITAPPVYLLDQYLESLGHEHDVIASVVVESHAMYRTSGPEAYRSIGETEFLNGQAAMSATGQYGSTRVAAGIVASVDLTLAEEALPVLEAHQRRAPDRLRGVRQGALWDPDPEIRGNFPGSREGLYADEQFRRGFAHLAPLGLSFDAFVFAPQLADVADLARAFPETQIVLNHVGQPMGIGRFSGHPAHDFASWSSAIRRVAEAPNVAVKLGGLGTYLANFPSFRSPEPFSSEALAEEWGPWVDTAIDAFGPERCMFESNLPTDASGSFTTVCNAFKRITGSMTLEDRSMIFAATAARIYRLGREVVAPLTRRDQP
jgi:L-fuconolactonase